MTIEQLAKEKNRTVEYVIKKLQDEGYLRNKNDTKNPKAQTANKELSDNAQICDDGTIIWDGRSEIGKKISSLIKVYRKNTQDGHNFDTFEEYCAASDYYEAASFESRGAKSYQFFLDKYSQYKKEDLEEELDNSNFEHDNYIQDGIHNIDIESKLYELENKIKALKYLLKKTTDSEWD